MRRSCFCRAALAPAALAAARGMEQAAVAAGPLYQSPDRPSALPSITMASAGGDLWAMARQQVASFEQRCAELQLTLAAERDALEAQEREAKKLESGERAFGGRGSEALEFHVPCCSIQPSQPSHPLLQSVQTLPSAPRRQRRGRRRRRPPPPSSGLPPTRPQASTRCCRSTWRCCAAA